MPPFENMSELRLLATQAVATLRPFLSAQQWAGLAKAFRGGDAAHFMELLAGVADRVRAMQMEGEQEGQGDRATVQLRYFLASCDWYIVAQDPIAGIERASGFVALEGAALDADPVIISIAELAACGAQLDLCFKPCSVAQLKAERLKARNPKPWVLVANPGEDHEDIIADFGRFADAAAAQKEAGEGDVMRRLDNGVLTTEF